jgi:2-phospho-L-lactate guanylyltransferase
VPRVAGLPRQRWRLVLPVKGGPGAKTRLGPHADREQLALAVALDCLAAVLATPAVAAALVVTADAGAAGEARTLGAQVVPESRPGAGLAAAIADGVAAAGRGPVGVLLPDLPALVPAELDAALRQAGQALDAGAGSVLVPDAEGTGTVLLAATDRARLRAAFGEGSAAAHEALGAVRLDLALPRLRRDVDTRAALREAVALGVGPRTAAVLAGPDTRGLPA